MLAVRLPRVVLVTNEVGVMEGETRHRASCLEGGGGGIVGSAVGVRRRKLDAVLFSCCWEESSEAPERLPALETGRSERDGGSWRSRPACSMMRLHIASHILLY